MNNLALNPSTGQLSKYDYDKRLTELNEEDKKRYLEMTSALSKNDLTTVQMYGHELSNTISNNGNALLNSVRGNNSSEIIQLTNDLLYQLNLIDIEELNSNNSFKRFLTKLPIIKNFVKTFENILIKYDDIKTNVDKITDKILSSKLIALRDNSTLQTIFDSNIMYIEQCRELIIAGKLKLQQLADELNTMYEHRADYDVYEISDFETFKTNLEKKVIDLQTVEYVLMQNLLQIRATQQNNYDIATKSDNIVTNVIPIWKNQLAINIIMNNQKKSVEAHQKITETTNKILRENANALKANCINVAKSNEEQIINMETLKETTQTLVDTIKEVKQIHEQGAQMRHDFESNIKTMVSQIEQALNEA